MVDFRPAQGIADASGAGIGEDLTLLVVEYNGTSATSPDGLPLHFLDVQVAMFEGVNKHLKRQSNPHLNWEAMRRGGSGNPLVGYSSDQMLEIVIAAWQQDDLLGETTALSDVTEQNVVGRDGTGVLGTVYVVRADVKGGLEGGSPRIVPGSVRKADESLIPREVMSEQYTARAAAWSAEAPEREAEVAMAAGRSVESIAPVRRSKSEADGPTV